MTYILQYMTENVTPKGDHRLSQRYSELYLNRKYNYKDSIF